MTFSKFCKIPILGYLQFIYLHQNKTDENSQADSRSDIQRRVRTISSYYNEMIKWRFDKLGLRDWAYEENKDNPLWVGSKFGDEESAANLVWEPKY